MENCFGLTLLILYIFFYSLDTFPYFPHFPGNIFYSLPALCILKYIVLYHIIKWITIVYSYLIVLSFHDRIE